MVDNWDDLGNYAGGDVVPEDLWGKLPRVDFQPLNDRVLVKREEAATMTKGGLVLPTNEKEKPTVGLVLAVGAGHLMVDGSVRPLTVKRGDRVVFGKYNGEEIKVGEDTYTLLKENDVYGITRAQ